MQLVLLIGLMLLVPAGTAALLRWARCPGWPVVGGVIGGLVLGPTILGRTAPQLYEDLFVGGVEKRRQLDVLRLYSLEHPRVEAPGDEAGSTARTDPIAQASDAWETAKWNHQRPLRGLAVAVVAATLLGAGLMRARGGQAPQPMVSPLTIGVWSAAFPGGLAFFAAGWLWSEHLAEAALVAAAVAIGPWVLTPFDREAADQAEIGGARMMEHAGRLATAIGVTLTVGALWVLKGSAALVWGGWGGAVVAAPLSWVMRPLASRWAAPLLEHVLLPALAAAVAVKIDLFSDFALWPIMILVLLSGDGRWLGAFLGAMVLGGRGSLRTMRLVMGAMAAGPHQLAVTAIAVHTWSIPGSLGLGLLLGAVFIETTAGFRRSMARRLAQTEEEVEAMRGEGK